MSFVSRYQLDIFSQQKESSLAAPLGSLLFSLQEIINRQEHVFVVSDETSQAEKIHESLSSIYDNVLYFPAIEVMPYSKGIPSLDILTARLQILSLLHQNQQPYIIVCSYKSFIRTLPPVSSFERSQISLYKEKYFPIDRLTKTFEDYGYSAVSIVREVGEFAIKNRLVDFFPSDSYKPVRMILDEDFNIASLSFFDIETQLTENKIPSLNLLPLAEFLLHKEKDGFGDFYQNPIAHSNFVDFYNKLSSITDYVQNRNFNILFADRADLADNKIRAIFNRLNAEKLLLSSINEATKNASSVYTQDINGKSFDYIKLEGNYSGGFTGFVIELEKLFAQNPNICVCFFAEYLENARRIAVMLRRFKPKVINSINDIPDDGYGFYIITNNWEFGFHAVDLNGRPILMLGETDINNKKKVFRKRLQQTVYSNFESDIVPGDSVVHLNYGIGIFKGIERINSLGKEKDYILIEYANQQKLFVPLEQADLIGRYTGGLDHKKPKIDSLSGKSWQKKKIKAQEDILKFAKQLVESHAKRLAMMGFAFPPDKEEQKIFEDKFAYIETPDQIRVIEEIKADMEKPQPMDRLLCGDVGFGKTEIALRAACKAILGGEKQVALLAPTTILAEQHYFTCLERFKDFPIKIALLSRFTSNEDRKDIIKQINNQEIDLIIGTHAILNKDIKFKDLGLLIIDEEHKFGVQHKENIKTRYPFTDILSLSATPIPRTLSLALGNLRAFSTMQTPPESRLSIETIVSDFQKDLVKDAIRSELGRGGQVYFIQNRIKELDIFADIVSELVPEASVVTAHGRMDEDQLDDAFLGFMRGYYNVLIATTIVENGLDIANANTLIVSDSHRLGLSQLYQLKGRVGRSNKQAYAYFLFPEHKNITEAATKRLDALSEYTELGAGFEIAKKDMEIRGAGNILGSEQHGHLIAIGFDMYIKLLSEEVKRIQGTLPDFIETLVDLSYDAYIPDSYISDPSLKMEAYKKIVAVKEQEESELLKKELKDRYGTFPYEIETLFEIARLKIEAGRLGIISITEKTNHIEIMFSNNSKVDPFKILEIAQNGKHPVSFNPYNPNMLNYQKFDATAEIKVRKMISFLRDIADTAAIEEQQKPPK